MTPFSQQKITFVAFLLFSVHHITNAQFLDSYCYPSLGNYSVLSNYGDNINEALTKLASLASTSYFNTVSVGNGTDKVNALFYCRYDVSQDDCQSCVKSTLENVPLCLPSVESIQFYQDCLLHYSNLTIFSTMEESPRMHIVGLRNVSDVEFTTLLSETVASLISDTVADTSRYFATTTAKYSNLETIYAIAQCIEDITSSECNKCLKNGFANFAIKYPEAYKGQIFKPSCRLSYKLSSVSMSRPYNFSAPTVTDNPSTPPTSPPNEDLTPPRPPPTPSLFADEPPSEEELTPPPPSRPSTGTKGVPTTLTSFTIVVLFFGLFLRNP